MHAVQPQLIEGLRYRARLEIDPELRRAYLGEKLQKANARLVANVDKREQDLDDFFAELDRSVQRQCSGSAAVRQQCGSATAVRRQCGSAAAVQQHSSVAAQCGVSSVV